MRWLGLTVAFLAATVALLAGIYLRDRVAHPPLPHQQSVAQREAEAVLASLAGSHCQPCGVALLRQSRHGHWLAQITIKQSVQCININVENFTWDAEHGFSGVTSVSCATARAGTTVSN